MIARYSFLLPFELTIDPDLVLERIAVRVAAEDVHVLPPMRANLLTSAPVLQPEARGATVALR